MNEESSTQMLLKFAKKLQDSRKGVPTFLFCAGFMPSTVLDVRKVLFDIPKGDEIDIILHSGGGSADDAYRLIRTFRSRYDVVNIVIPFWAKSAATIFAFGGSRIVLHEFGELGPLDAQVKKNDDDGTDIGYSSALNVQSSLQQIEDRARVGVIEMFKTISDNPDVRINKKQLFEMLLTHSSHFYEPLMQKIDTMEIGTMARALEIGAMYAKRILKTYSSTTDEKLKDLLDFLVYESPDHGYVVDYSILHQYLDSVILASEEPFSTEYYGILDVISLLLMDRDDISAVGFVDELLKVKEEKSGKIKSKKEGLIENGATDKRTDSNTRATEDKSHSGDGKEESSENKDSEQVRTATAQDTSSALSEGWRSKK